MLLKPKPEMPPDEMQQVLAQVRTLQQSIPGIVDVQTGENLSASHQGYTYGFIMHFVDREHLKAYAPHPVENQGRFWCEDVMGGLLVVERQS